MKIINIIKAAAAPSTTNTTSHELHDDDARLQHTNDVTDQYLSYLFTPSIANITTVASETSLGLNTLFNNNNRTVRHVSSAETSLGLRTLFEEGNVDAPAAAEENSMIVCRWCEKVVGKNEDRGFVFTRSFTIPRDHHDDDARVQHTNEVTDRYLSHLFTPSIANLTTVHDQHFRTLLSCASHHSVVSDTSLGLNTLFNNDNHSLCHVSSHETSLGLRTLFDEGNVEKLDLDEQSDRRLRNLFSSASEHSKLRTVASETLGLNTLFNNNASLHQVSLDDSSLGLRTLFEEVEEKLALDEETDERLSSVSECSTCASDTSLGLNTLFNNVNHSLCHVSSHETSLGLRTLFGQSNVDVEADERLQNLLSECSTCTSDISLFFLPSRHVSSDETSFGLRTLFDEGHVEKLASDDVETDERLRNLFSSVSEHSTCTSDTSLGLTTLSNYNPSSCHVSSAETSLGLRTLFDEGNVDAPAAAEEKPMIVCRWCEKAVGKSEDRLVAFSRSYTPREASLGLRTLNDDEGNVNAAAKKTPKDGHSDA